MAAMSYGRRGSGGDGGRRYSELGQHIRHGNYQHLKSLERTIGGHVAGLMPHEYQSNPKGWERVPVPGGRRRGSRGSRPSKEVGEVFPDIMSRKNTNEASSMDGRRHPDVQSRRGRKSKKATKARRYTAEDVRQEQALRIARDKENMSQQMLNRSSPIPPPSPVRSTPLKNSGSSFLGQSLSEEEEPFGSSPLDAPMKATKRRSIAPATPTRLYVGGEEGGAEGKERSQDDENREWEHDEEDETGFRLGSPATPDLMKRMGQKYSEDNEVRTPLAKTMPRNGATMPGTPERKSSARDAIEHSESDVDEPSSEVSVGNPFAPSEHERKIDERLHNEYGHRFDDASYSPQPSPAACRRSRLSQPPTSPLRSPAVRTSRASQFVSDRSPAIDMARLRPTRQQKARFRPKTPLRAAEQEENPRASRRPHGRRFSSGRGQHLRQHAMGSDDENENDNNAPGGFDIIFSRARHGRFAEVQAAMDSGMPVGATDRHGNTLLHVACQNGHKKLAKMCMRRGADLNAQNHAGNTGLHFCFMYAYYGLGEYLLSKGADDTIVNGEGATCYDADQ